MKSKIYMLICFAFFITRSLAQAPSIQWEKSLGGTNYDYGSSIRQTTDGGFIITGSSKSNNWDITGHHGDYDVWVVKLSVTGAIQWQKALGGGGEDVSNCIQQTIDGGYIIAGSSKSGDGDVTTNHGGYDFWIIKLSSSGSVQWQRTCGGSQDDNAYSIQQTTDSGYIVAGRSYSTDGDVSGHHGTVGNADFWVIKLSQAGGLQWQKALGGSLHDNAMSIQQTSDNGFIVAGDANSNDGDVTGNHGGGDYWVVKLDATGNMQWQKTLGGSGSDYAQSVLQSEDGGYVVAGGSNSTDADISGNKGSGDFWIVKLSSAGNIVWQRPYGSTHNDVANSISQTVDGGYIVGGYATFNDADVLGLHGSSDYWLIKITAAGNLTWQKCLGSLGDDVACDVMQTSDSGYIVAGYSFYYGGDVSFSHGQNDYWVVKLNTPVGVNELQLPGIKITPNPVIDEITVSPAWPGKMLIYSTVGQLMRECSNAGTISLGSLPQGMYLVTLQDDAGQTCYCERLMKW